MEKEMKIYKVEITLNSKIEWFVKANSKEEAKEIVDWELGDTDKCREVEMILNENSYIDINTKETNLKEQDVGDDLLLPFNDEDDNYEED